MKNTQEQKKIYWQNIRQLWKEKTKDCEKDEELKEKFAMSKIPNLSLKSFAFVDAQMQEQKLGGIPYVHTKTFKKWQEEGRTVRRGEKSTLQGIVWVNGNSKDKSEEQEEEGNLYPKIYYLFHLNQTHEITKKND